MPLRISSFDCQSSTTSSHVPLLQNNAPRRTAPIELNAHTYIIRWRFCTGELVLTMMNPARRTSHIVHAAVVLAIALRKQHNCRSSVAVNSRGTDWMSRAHFVPNCPRTMRQARGRRCNWLLAWRGAHLRRMRPSRRRMNRLPMGKVRRRLATMTYRHLKSNCVHRWIDERCDTMQYDAMQCNSRGAQNETTQMVANRHRQTTAEGEKDSQEREEERGKMEESKRSENQDNRYTPKGEEIKSKWNIYHSNLNKLIWFLLTLLQSLTLDESTLNLIASEIAS